MKSPPIETWSPRDWSPLIHRFDHTCDCSLAIDREVRGKEKKHWESCRATKSRCRSRKRLSSKPKWFDKSLVAPKTPFKLQSKTSFREEKKQQREKKEKLRMSLKSNRNQFHFLSQNFAAFLMDWLKLKTPWNKLIGDIFVGDDFSWNYNSWKTLNDHSPRTKNVPFLDKVKIRLG